MRILLVFLVFIESIFGASFTYPDFKQCFKKNLNSIVYIGDTKAIAIAPHYAIAYSTKRPNAKYIKHDPYLGLYLFYSKKKLKPVRLKETKNLALGEWLAAINNDSLYIGNFAKKEGGLDGFYEHNTKVEPNSMITCLCCDVYGLGVGDNKFIPTKFLKRFLNSKEIFYGDIGVRFVKRGEDIVVDKIDPFFQDSILRVGDIIRKINGKRVKDINDIKDIILFSNKKDFVSVEFLRGKKLQKGKIKVDKRFGGGVLSDTFLERYGIFFDNNMKIKWIKQKSFAHDIGLKVGDKLLAINQKRVSSDKEAREILSKLKRGRASLLFERSNFQFFVEVK